jgi:hypothetical protein
MKVPGITIDIAAGIIQYVENNPDIAEIIDDVVHADGAQRRSDNTYVEPGQDLETAEEQAEAAPADGETKTEAAAPKSDDPFARAAEYAEQMETERRENQLGEES